MRRTQGCSSLGSLGMSSWVGRRGYFYRLIIDLERSFFHVKKIKQMRTRAHNSQVHGELIVLELIEHSQ